MPRARYRHGPPRPKQNPMTQALWSGEIHGGVPPLLKMGPWKGRSGPNNACRFLIVSMLHNMNFNFFCKIFTEAMKHQCRAIARWHSAPRKPGFHLRRCTLRIVAGHFCNWAVDYWSISYFPALTSRHKNRPEGFLLVSLQQDYFGGQRVSEGTTQFLKNTLGELLKQTQHGC